MEITVLSIALLLAVVFVPPVRSLVLRILLVMFGLRGRDPDF